LADLNYSEEERRGRRHPTNTEVFRNPKAYEENIGRKEEINRNIVSPNVRKGRARALGEGFYRKGDWKASITKQGATNSADR